METSYDEMLQGLVWFYLNVSTINAIRTIEQNPETYDSDIEM